MFTPLGLFQDIPCPQGDQCTLLTCIFSHKVAASPADQRQDASQPAASDEPALKRIKVEPTPQAKPEDTKLPPPRDEEKPQPALSAHAANGESRQQSQRPVKLHSASRDVSPPPTRAGPTQIKPEPTPAKAGSAGPGRLRQAPKESLNPRMVPKAPAPHNVRSAIVAKLHSAICALNDKLEKSAKGPERHLVLSPNELITMALDEEEKVAKENTSIYSNIVKLRAVKLSKMNLEDWLKEVKTHLNSRYYKIESDEQPQKPKPFTTGLSAKEEIAISSKLVTPLEGLEPFGYVTRPPTEEETEQARKGALESKGWEKCDRCGGRFQVFPGRREDGLLTTGGQCTHHPGKPLYPPRKKTDHITGPRDAYYSCCNEALGTSSGCTRGETHVFKVSEAKRLASILQFEKTPDQPGKGPQRPVCFDCEMGYTTQGLELVRLTAVTWPEGKVLLDILVRPFGEILDLNSRFSGIFPEHYATAIPYGSKVPDTVSSAPEDGEVETAPMQVVDSPAVARELLFKHLQPDTPLIGHAIDNDLNACRIIHPTVIDTVLLYPHQAGLPIRMSLKMLARRHLDRDIQTGGNHGHDSMEDSVATGDLVRAKVLETWKRLKGRGWSIQDGKLIAPPGGETDARALGPGAGQKRKGSGEAT
ncbi:hypothetical protein PHISP_00848 [Aspergillus sp. HF37]|nr:hypothetical protein PHISP_00848 [Aspergillus sp. HF37]